MPAFRHRGLVEGFYGPPWAHEDRLWMLERIGRWGMNRYVYAPKDDPLHRERWAEPYPEATLRQFDELVRRGADAGVDVGFALSPGLSIVYSSKEDRAALLAKLQGFVALGARWVVLAVDDVPTELTHEADRRAYPSLAHAHVDVLCALREALDSGVELWMVPTEYLGTASCAYLEHLGRALPAEIEIAWTGRTVLSPTVEVHEALARAETLRRSPWLWDNLPVADGPMRNMLHLAPYLGRDPGLRAALAGILLNPMQHARASAVTVYTACAYMRDPERYDPEAAWQAALAELGDGAPAALEHFAHAHRFAPQSPDVRDLQLEDAFEQLCHALERGADLVPAVQLLRARVDARSGVADRLRDDLTDRRLAQELDPWLESHRVETARMQIALDALLVLIGEASRGKKLNAYMRMEGRLTRLVPARVTSYGPRRVLYPQLASMRDEDMGFGADPGLIRDRNLADEIVDFVADLALWILRETP